MVAVLDGEIFALEVFFAGVNADPAALEGAFLTTFFTVAFATGFLETGFLVTVFTAGFFTCGFFAAFTDCLTAAPCLAPFEEALAAGLTGFLAGFFLAISDCERIREGCSVFVLKNGGGACYI